MNFKRLVSVLILSAVLFLLNVGVSAENAVENSIDKTKFADVLVSFLYFAGVLVLIYVILVLVNKWGKKRQNDNKNCNLKEEYKEVSVGKEKYCGAPAETHIQTQETEKNAAENTANSENKGEE